MMAELVSTRLWAAAMKAVSAADAHAEIVVGVLAALVAVIASSFLAARVRRQPQPPEHTEASRIQQPAGKKQRRHHPAGLTVAVDGGRAARRTYSAKRLQDENFNVVDTNFDSVVTPQEFTAGLLQGNISKGDSYRDIDATTLFNKIDPNHDGTLTPEEWRAAIRTGKVRVGRDWVPGPAPRGGGRSLAGV